MKKALLFSLLWFCGCTHQHVHHSDFPKQKFEQTITDSRDGQIYGIVEIENQIWFAQNLNFQTPNSLCFKRKNKNCQKHGRLYQCFDLDAACPKGWRVPTLDEWEILKSNFSENPILNLMDTVGFSNPINHTNQSGLSLRGVGYQMKKRLFIGEGEGISIWLNQMNKYEEYFHAHLWGGEGAHFKKTNFRTNEILHAHPIENLKNRRFSIRCVCDKL